MYAILTTFVCLMDNVFHTSPQTAVCPHNGSCPSRSLTILSLVQRVFTLFSGAYQTFSLAADL